MMADPQGNRSEARAERAVLGGGGDKGGVPFKIEGTTSDPKFVPDIGGMAADAAKEVIQKSVSQTTGGKAGLGGVFGKKKAKQ
jgi:AsmA protein